MSLFSYELTRFEIHHLFPVSMFALAWVSGRVDRTGRDGHVASRHRPRDLGPRRKVGAQVISRPV